MGLRDTHKGITIGRQFPITGDGTLAGSESVAALAGVALTEGTYYYSIPVIGNSAVDVTLRPSSISGAITPALYKTMVDRQTIKGAEVPFGAALVDDTQATQSITDLRGEQRVILKIEVPSGASVTFDQAEYSAL